MQWKIRAEQNRHRKHTGDVDYCLRTSCFLDYFGRGGGGGDICFTDWRFSTTKVISAEM